MCLNHIQKYQRKGINVIPVFDEISRTPLKEAIAGKERNDPHAKAQSVLQKLLATPWPNNKTKQKEIIAEIAQKCRASARVNANAVAEGMRVCDDQGLDYVVAPFEADWQLAYMYNIGLVDAIKTTDSDYWALIDHPCYLLNMNSSNMKAWICID